MPTIPENYLDLFTKKSFAHVATVMADGSPQVTPVWIDYDGTHVVINDRSAGPRSAHVAHAQPAKSPATSVA